MSQAEAGAERISLRKQVQALLIAEDRLSLAGSLGMFLKGLGFCVGIGVVLASVLVFTVGGLPWIGWLGVYLVILISLLVWYERTNRKDYVVASLQEDVSNASTENKRDLLNWGPRQLLDGLAALRGRRSGDQTARFRRASQALLELAKYSGGVEVKAIMHPPENMPVFMAAIDWLDRHDYIGRSSDGERLWVSTIGKKKMSDKGINPKITEV